jgi:hypothetical protein
MEQLPWRQIWSAHAEDMLAPGGWMESMWTQGKRRASAFVGDFGSGVGEIELLQVSGSVQPQCMQMPCRIV